MKTSNVLLLVGLAAGGYLFYKWYQAQQAATAQALAQSAANLGSNPTLLDALSSGLQAGIGAGTYNAQALRMSGGNTLTGSLQGYRG